MISGLLKLKHSRAQELEADTLGMILMSKACYDPRYSISFFKKLSDMDRNNDNHTYFSTHPGHAVRMLNANENLSNNISYYNECSYSFFR